MLYFHEEVLVIKMLPTEDCEYKKAVAAKIQILKLYRTERAITYQNQNP